MTRRAIASLSTNPRIALLGELGAARLPIVSFLIRHDDGFLHHNFVVALLSDLFGIQARGGCSCAGPYGHALLGIDADSELGFEREVLCGRLGIKPGWVRVGFSFLTSETTFEYALRAVHWVAEHGYRLLGDYVFHPESGEWSHRDSSPEPVAQLSSIQYSGGRMQYPVWDATLPESALAGYLQEATSIVNLRRSGPRGEACKLPPSFEELRWFPLPGEAEPHLRGQYRGRIPSRT